MDSPVTESVPTRRLPEPVAFVKVSAVLETLVKLGVVGKVNVWTVPLEVTSNTLPPVEVAKVCMLAFNPFKLVIADVKPQSAPTPETTPFALTWRHCVEPVILESVSAPTVELDDRSSVDDTVPLTLKSAVEDAQVKLVSELTVEVPIQKVTPADVPVPTAGVSTVQNGSVGAQVGESVSPGSYGLRGGAARIGRTTKNMRKKNMLPPAPESTSFRRFRPSAF